MVAELGLPGHGIAAQAIDVGGINRPAYDAATCPGGAQLPRPAGNRIESENHHTLKWRIWSYKPATGWRAIGKGGKG